jgi:tetratricopeptide (TPR) repeat protein
MAESGLAGNRIPVRLERFGGGVVDQIDTDSTGRFRFSNLPRGYYRVIVNAPGYKPAQQDADLQVVYRAYMVFELSVERAGNIALLDVIDARAPAEAREQLTRGRTALGHKSYAEAIGHLQRAIVIYPEFYEAHLLLGTAYVDQREWTKAESIFQRAVELKPESAAAILALGEVYWREQRFEEAEKTLLAGLKLDDNILLKVNQQERALSEYNEYLRLDPKGEFAAPTRELVEKLGKVIGDHKKSSN